MHVSHRVIVLEAADERMSLIGVHGAIDAHEEDALLAQEVTQRVQHHLFVSMFPPERPEPIQFNSIQPEQNRTNNVKG